MKQFLTHPKTGDVLDIRIPFRIAMLRANLSMKLFVAKYGLDGAYINRIAAGNVGARNKFLRHDIEEFCEIYAPADLEQAHVLYHQRNDTKTTEVYLRQVKALAEREAEAKQRIMRMNR